MPPVRALTRIGLIGDVHAQAGRLERAIEFLSATGAEHVLCTGDIADGPGDVNHCCALLDEHGVSTVRGNHDRWLLTDKVRHVPHAHSLDELSARSIRYLRSLPMSIQLDTVAGPLLLCHGVANNDTQKVWPGSERKGPDKSEDLDQLIADDEVRIVVNGHMHFRIILEFQRMTFLNAGTLKDSPACGVSLLDLKDGTDLSTATVNYYRFDEADNITHQMSAPLRAGGQRRIWKDTQEFDGDWEVFRVT
ncbi:MAG: metallophosphatase family protein [Gammaproteobacteria bacterium]|nr:metallophosphatase family protein [Gammaproteobacteria bacterium]